MWFSSRMLPFAIVIWTLLMFRYSDAAKVLFFNGMGEGSHYTAAAPVAEVLASRGVSVTFVLSESFRFRSEHPLHSRIFEFEIIRTRATKEDFDRRLIPFVLLALRGAPVTDMIRTFVKAHEQIAEDCEDLFEEEILNRLKAEGFDLAVYDPSWPCSLLLAEYLNVTTVAFIPTSLIPGVVRSYGNPLNPAFVADAGMGLPVKMNFWTRITNVFLAGIYELILTWRPGYDEIREQFNIQNGWRKSAANTALVLTCSDTVIDQKVPTMPHVKLVGGISTHPSDPLLEDLEEYMQSSGEHGVIIFSLGSYVAYLPQELLEIFQEAFRRLPQKVVWQWKNPEPPKDMPKNVKTMAWLPQNDLLGHNKTRLLFYQGGNNGLYEAIYHGVPLLVLPLIADQPDVAQRVVEREVGLKLDASKITTESIVDAVTTILSDSKYKTNMELMSAIYRDRPQHPRDRAAYWIEHVLKYGAEHLKPPVHDLNIIQLNMIDIYVFFIAVLSVIGYAIYRVLKFICSNLWRKCCSKEKSKSD